MSDDDLVSRLEAFSDPHDMICYGKNCGACQEIRDVRAAAVLITELKADVAYWTAASAGDAVRITELEAEVSAYNDTMVVVAEQRNVAEAENGRLQEMLLHFRQAYNGMKEEAEGLREAGQQLADTLDDTWAKCWCNAVVADGYRVVAALAAWAALSGEPT